MSSLIEFLTSKEIIIVYVISALSCMICFIIYIVEKNNEKFRRRHNTKELNKLVEQLKDEYEEDEETVNYENPILSPITVDVNESANVEEMLQKTGQLKIVDSKPQYKTMTIEPKKSANTIEELEYTTIEPDQETAKLELKKLEEELFKQELNKNSENNTTKVEYEEPIIIEEHKQKDNKAVENIKLTNYEEEQEASAIISLDELIKKGRDIYEANELTQYKDEGNEPISLQDLEKQSNRQAARYEELFDIENIIEKSEIAQAKSEAGLDNSKRFQNSPIISPIYGIESINNKEPNELELENTANYEKLDQEIKKTNEFLMSLKDLQNKLD